MSSRVVVIGGGLAGITAAIALRDAGADVTLLESRPRLGGSASSYVRAGMTIDNGQHVFLRCCTSYRELLGRLGATSQVRIQDRFDVTVLSGTGKRPARLRRTSLPSPLHLAGSLARYGLLSPGQRARVGRAALAFKFADPADPRLDAQRLGPWLAARGQDEQTRRRLWDLFVISTLNIGGDDANVGLAAKVVRTALLGQPDAADIGMAAVPLGRLHADAAGAVLDRLGVTVCLQARAAAIERLADGGFRVSLSRGEDSADAGEAGRAEDAGGLGNAAGSPAAGQPLLADAVVLAVPSGQAARLAGSANVSEAANWAAVEHSPIVNVHVIYDRNVMDLPFVAAVDSPVQWVFDKTGQSGLTAGQYLAVSLSAADEYVDMPVADLRRMFLPALERLFPAAAGAGIADFS